LEEGQLALPIAVESVGLLAWLVVPNFLQANPSADAKTPSNQVPKRRMFITTKTEFHNHL